MFRRALMLSTFLRSPDDTAAAAAPVVEEAAAAAAAVAAPAPEPAPAPDPAPAPEPAPAPDADADPAKAAASLLSAAERPAGDKPADAAPAPAPAADADPAKAAADAAAAAAAPTVEVAAEPIKYDFKLPETVKADPEALTAFTDMLQTNKIPAELGQALLDRHVAEMTKFAEHTAREQHRIFNETVKDWATQSLADPEIGGNSHTTSMQAIATVRDALFQGDDLKAFNQLLDTTGVGNHPLMLKAFKRMSRFMNEPAAPSIPINPAPNNGQKPGKKGMRTVYNHPTSQSAES